MIPGVQLHIVRSNFELNPREFPREDTESKKIVSIVGNLYNQVVL